MTVQETTAPRLASQADTTPHPFTASIERAEALTAQYESRLAHERDKMQRDLYHDGDVRRPRYMPDAHPARVAEHERRIAAVVDEFRAQMRLFDEDAAGVITSYTAKLQQLDHADPLDRLSPADLQRATARLPQIEQDAARMSPAALAERLAVEQARGDTPVATAWLRAARARAAAERAVHLQDDGDPHYVLLSDGERILAAAIGDLAATLDPAAAAKRTKAHAWIAGAEQLKQTTQLARMRFDPEVRRDYARRWGIKGLD
jgi:hypothetical protein